MNYDGQVEWGKKFWKYGIRIRSGRKFDDRVIKIDSWTLCVGRYVRPHWLPCSHRGRHLRCLSVHQKGDPQRLSAVEQAINSFFCRPRNIVKCGVCDQKSKCLSACLSVCHRLLPAYWRKIVNLCLSVDADDCVRYVPSAANQHTSWRSLIDS